MVRTDDVLKGYAIPACVSERWKFQFVPLTFTDVYNEFGEYETLDVSYHYERESDVRATYSFTIHVAKDVFTSIVDWKSALIRIYNIHIAEDGTETQTLSGDYVVNSDSLSYNATTSTLSFSCSDLSVLLMNTRGGALTSNGNGLLIKAGEYVADFIQDFVTMFSPFTIDYYNVYMPTSLETLPYDLEFDATSTIWDVLCKIRDLLPNLDCWVSTYEHDGSVVRTLNFTTTEWYWQHAPHWYAHYFHKAIVSQQTNRNYDNIVNVTEVYGKDYAFYGISRNTYPTSPYNISNYYECRQVLNFDMLTSDEECENMAEWENFKCMISKDTYTFEVVNALGYNMFNIQANVQGESIIEFIDWRGEINKYIINSVDYSKCVWSITCTPFVPTFPDDYYGNQLPPPDVNHTLEDGMLTVNSSYDEGSGVSYYTENEVVHSEAVFKVFYGSGKAFVGESIGAFRYYLTEHIIYDFWIQAYCDNRAPSEYVHISVDNRGGEATYLMDELGNYLIDESGNNLIE